MQVFYRGNSRGGEVGGERRVLTVYRIRLAVSESAVCWRPLAGEISLRSGARWTSNLQPEEGKTNSAWGYNLCLHRYPGTVLVEEAEFVSGSRPRPCRENTHLMWTVNGQGRGSVMKGEAGGGGGLQNNIVGQPERPETLGPYDVVNLARR